MAQVSYDLQLLFAVLAQHGRKEKQDFHETTPGRNLVLSASGCNSNRSFTVLDAVILRLGMVLL